MKQRWLLIFLFAAGICSAQQQPLNANVSDFGTSFFFDPPPICQGCIETELGLISLNGEQFLSSVITVAPLKSHTDISILANVLDSENLYGQRATHFGDHLDFVIRQQVLAKNGFVLTLAPRGTIFLRDSDGGRIGGAVGAQYGKGKSLEIVNFTLTKSLSNPASAYRNDYLGSFDYYRTLTAKGMGCFAGIEHELATGIGNTIGVEQGVVFPFRNGQVEVAVQELDLNRKAVIQFQARVIVNWGQVFHVHH